MKQSPICSNSMGCSEIWNKYHGRCIKISIFNASRVIFIPNFTAIPKLIPYPSYIVSSVFRVVLLQDSQLLRLPKNLLLCTKHTSILHNCCTKFHSYSIPTLASLPVHSHLVTSVAMQFVAVH